MSRNLKYVLKSYCLEKLMFSKLRFSKFKWFVSRSVLGELQLSKYHWVLISFIATLKSEVWEQSCVWLFYYFNFEINFEVLMSKSLYFLLNKNINLIKTKRNRKLKILHELLERQTFWYSSYKNRELKVKLWWAGARERKKRI